MHLFSCLFVVGKRDVVKWGKKERRLTSINSSWESAWCCSTWLASKPKLVLMEDAYVDDWGSKSTRDTSSRFKGSSNVTKEEEDKSSSSGQLINVLGSLANKVLKKPNPASTPSPHAKVLKLLHCWIFIFHLFLLTNTCNQNPNMVLVTPQCNKYYTFEHYSLSPFAPYILLDLIPNCFTWAHGFMVFPFVVHGFELLLSPHVCSWNAMDLWKFHAFAKFKWTIFSFVD